MTTARRWFFLLVFALLPATALGLTALFKDGEGAMEFGKSAAVSMAVTFGLKYSIRARRPTGILPGRHAASR